VYPEQIRFVLGTAGFLLISSPSLFVFGTFRSPMVHALIFPLYTTVYTLQYSSLYIKTKESYAAHIHLKSLTEINPDSLTLKLVDIGRLVGIFEDIKKKKKIESKKQNKKTKQTKTTPGM
jgi:hypothetical protein